MNLTNHFLIAMPDMDDPFFTDSVVYICEHNDDGALGIVINKPSPITMDMIFAASGRNIPQRMQHDSVMMGGPVQIDRGYVLHTPIGDWQNSMIVTDDIALTSSRDVIENITENVDKALVSIGYSSWRKGQLERELANNGWLTVPADEHILFDVPYEHRYAAAFAKLGFSPSALAAGAGHA
ncbi:YqgE/AlgH family protein [Neisseria perflava]|uniref:YqgE/AlgH family protein n=1 Tax=Neisseria perflava TaxID=33053 RepID=UPI00209DA57C|nr:YqgE/AlgH family protein [Neisseria perflava]MCP1659556.1 putative transcriptional regulator [Neisseria perflava]MCP1772464.1 putative transcriptional regulator [Neisseria perflava]